MNVVRNKPCTRCRGKKVFPQWKHIDGGRCFKCNGSGIEREKQICFSLSKGKSKVEFLVPYKGARKVHVIFLKDDRIDIQCLADREAAKETYRFLASLGYS